MKTSIPDRNRRVVNSSPSRILANESAHHMRGIFYHFAFLTLLAGLILALIAIVKDDMTRITFHSSSGSYVEYCGWHDVHGYDAEESYIGTPYTYKYASNCKNNSHACKMRTVGRAWYSLLIIGLVFGGFALITFILDFSIPLTYLLILSFDLLFFLCMFANSLLWGLYKPCYKSCHKLEFSNLPTDITSCSATWAISWILVIVAGGLSLLTMILLTISRFILNKRY